MLVQQDELVLEEEVIDFFLADLKKSVNARSEDIIPLENYDSYFLLTNKRRVIGDFWKDSINLSVEFWKKRIKGRMDFYFKNIFLNNPFVSYAENISWLRLAFDIAKKEVADPKEYRSAWLRVLFPNLVLHKIAGRNYCIDPITFKPHFLTGNAKVHLVKSLPNFAQLKDYRERKNEKGIRRILHDFYLKFYDSYFYVFNNNLDNSQLYYVYSDGVVENLYVKDKRVFHDSLINLYENSHIIEKNIFKDEELYLTSTPTLKLVPLEPLEDLIVRCGGYPNLDLRYFYINESRTQLFSRQSFILLFRNTYPEKISLEMMYNLNKIKFVHNTHPFDNYEDIVTHLIYEKFASITPRALTLAEISQVREKIETVPMSNGRYIFTLSRRALNDIFALKFLRFSGCVSNYLLSDFLLVLKDYPINGDFLKYEKFRNKVNEWSKNIYKNNFQQIYKVFKSDFVELLPADKYSYLQSHCTNNDAIYSWTFSGIKEFYIFLGSCIYLTKFGRTDIYRVIDLLMEVILNRDLELVINEVQALILFGLERCPDKLPLFSQFDFFVDLRNKVSGNKKLHAKFTEILPYASPDLETDIKSIIRALRDLPDDSGLYTITINRIKRVFARHDQQVKFTKYDHNKEATEKSIKWLELAKLVASMGYCDDYLKLLCPELAYYNDPVTGKPFSSLSLRYCVFSYDRKYLINLLHSYNMFKVLGLAFDCSGPQLRYLLPPEIMQIAEADKFFRGFYKELLKKNFHQTKFNFRFILGINRLVNSTNFPKKSKDEIDFQVITTPEQKDSSSCVFNYFYNRFCQITTIKILDVESGVRCFINYNNSTDCDVIVNVSNDEFAKQPKRPITDVSFARHTLELQNILAKKSYLPICDDPNQQKIINFEYGIFDTFYNNLPYQERSYLDSIIILHENKLVYLKDVIYWAKYNVYDANFYFINILNKYYPQISFNNAIKNNYAGKFVFPKNSQQCMDFINSHTEIEKIFISLMTHNFIPKNCYPFCYKAYSVTDVVDVLPINQILENLSVAFKAYYMGSNNCFTDIEHQVKFLYKIFIETFYSQIDYYANKKFEGAIFAEVYKWITNILNGNLFAFMPIFEINEIIDIIEVLERSDAMFSLSANAHIKNFIYELRKLELLSNSTDRAVANIRLIKFLFSLNRYNLELAPESIFSPGEQLQPYKIYLGEKRNYILLNHKDEVRKGFFNQNEIDYRTIKASINEFEVRKKVLDIMVDLEHISAAETDFVTLLDIVYKNKKLSPLTYKLVQSFLLSQGIEETNKANIKKNLLKIFAPHLFSVLCNKSSYPGFFTRSIEDLKFTQIVEIILDEKNRIPLKPSLARCLSPGDIGLEL